MSTKELPPSIRYLAPGIGLALVLHYAWNFGSRFFHETPNTSVRLKGCDTEGCEIRGTLKTDPWSGDYLLVLADGSTVRFHPSAMSRASWPAPE